MKRIGFPASILLFACTVFGTISAGSGVQLPVRVFSADATAVVENVRVEVPAEANAARWLYAQIHNLRFGGQVSVRVNEGSWVDLYNDTVEVMEPEKGQGGIGGINATVRILISLEDDQVIAGRPNLVGFRLNGTNGVVSGIRVIDFDFLDADGIGLLDTDAFVEEDPSEWDKNGASAAEISAGEALWSGADLIDDPIHQRAIYGKCASCHFEDGSDMTYFNYSSDALVTRSMFHGLSREEGELIAGYIRSLDVPNPGRPWDPPFQPGPNLDPKPGDTDEERQRKVESWMAGAGLEWVIEDESKILPYVFPEGTSRASIAKVIDHETTFSVREIPIPIQFPDWNAWLPQLALEDMWESASYYDEPYALYQTLRSALESQGGEGLASEGNLNERFRRFKSDLEDWYGTFRLPDENLSNDTAVSLARIEGLTREDVIKSLMRWMVVKMTELTREFDLEGIQDDVLAMQGKGEPNFTPELLSIPGGENRSIVFGLAPHISGNVYLHFENQPEHWGKMESNQWYHMQLCLNSGHRRQLNMNAPLDWAYQVIHLESASERAGRKYGIQRLITQIKMLQMRETGKGIQQGGFSQRTLNPCFFYSTPHRDRSLMSSALDAIEPGLWRKVFEEYLYEWLDVIQTHNLDTMPRDDADRHQFETESYVPKPWPGGNAKYFDRPGEVHADALYRLLPLLPSEDIDEMLLEDIRAWCERAWPYDAGRWGATPRWESLYALSRLYAENFEDEASDFSGLELVRIKNANYVNNDAIEPQSGGGVFVAGGPLAGDGRLESVNSGIDADLNGAVRLKARARVAFSDADKVQPGDVRFKVNVRFDGADSLYAFEETLQLDAELFNREFVTFESLLNVPAGAEKITWISVVWERVGGAGTGTAYLDNFHILPLNDLLDTTAPSAPQITNVTRPQDLELRVNWNETNPAEEGVVGYNVYRWAEGEPESSKRKMNVGLVDNPYIRFEDFTVKREVEYHYQITAVDAAGNESEPSESESNQIADTDEPRPPSVIWAKNGIDTIELSWFGVMDWDASGYRLYRKAENESSFSVVNQSSDSIDGLSFKDEEVTEGISYDYYLESLDETGRASEASSVVRLQAESIGSYFAQWSGTFSGINGWDAEDLLVSGEAIDFDEDGNANLWEYLQGGDPTLAETSRNRALSFRIVSDDEGGLIEASYLRKATLPEGLVVRVRFSDDLKNWSNAQVVEGAFPSLDLEVTEGAIVEGMRWVHVKPTEALSLSKDFRFVRFSVGEN